MPISDVIKRMHEELEEVRIVYNNLIYYEDWCKLKKEAADVANFAMMLADLIDKRYLNPQYLNPSEMIE